MIVTETIIIDGRDLIKTYSDSGRYVVRDGISYEEAIDPAEFNREYEEGDIIPNPSFSAEDALNIILGRESYE